MDALKINKTGKKVETLNDFQLFEGINRVYSPANIPSPETIGAVNKAGDIMTGTLSVPSGFIVGGVNVIGTSPDVVRMGDADRPFIINAKDHLVKVSNGLLEQTIYHTGYLPTLSDLKVYSKTEADSRFLNNTGDSFTGKLVSSSRDGGLVGGTYDSNKIDQIWAIGNSVSYQSSADGSNFGTLYGLAYKHTNNTAGGTMAGGHQAVWCVSGVPKAAIGEQGIWTSGYYNGNGSKLTGITASQVGALPISGGNVGGALHVRGDLSTDGVLSEKGNRVYSPNNKPTANDVQAIPRNNTNGTPVAAYYLTNGKGATGTKIRLPFKTDSGKMVSFTVRVYQGYTTADVQFSGYLYETSNQWFSPNAIMIAGSTPIEVSMGRDDDGQAYVWLAGKEHRGVAVFDVVGGYNTADWNTGWSITEDDHRPNAVLVDTLHPPYSKHNLPTFLDTGFSNKDHWNGAPASKLIGGAVVSQLGWQGFGNSHTIFDASGGLSPSGTSVSKADVTYHWTPYYPTLMGWNGTDTYGVRVDSCRWADGAATATDLAGTVSTVGQDLKIHGKRAMVGDGAGNTLILNYAGDFTNGVRVDGGFGATRSITGNSSANFYTNSGIITNGDNVANSIRPSIGFHKPGHYAGMIDMLGERSFRVLNGDATLHASLEVQDLTAMGVVNGKLNTTVRGFSHNLSGVMPNPAIVVNNVLVPDQHNAYYAPIIGGMCSVNGYGYGNHFSMGWFRPAYGAFGSVYIATGGSDASPTVHFLFDSGGDFVAPANVTAYSDRRVKTEIKNIDNALDKVLKLNGVTYKRTDLEDKDKLHTGLISQEVEAVLPEAVHTSENGDIKDFKSVAYGNLVGLLVEAIKEQQNQIEELKEVVNGLTK